MAYEKYNPINTDNGLLALDPYRVHEQDGAKFTDLGEDVEVSQEMMSFLNYNM